MADIFDYAIGILREQVYSDSYDLTWAINNNDKEIEEKMRERLRQLQDAMNYLSNGNLSNQKRHET